MTLSPPAVNQILKRWWWLANCCTIYIMHPNFVIKSFLHSFAALLTTVYAIYIFNSHTLTAIVLLVAALAMLALIFYHQKAFPLFPLKTSLFFLFESLVLALIAWQLYRQGFNKATFFFEGFSIFYVCLGAFALLLRKKRHVLFREEDIKEA
ncbi:MAG TPA: hypothetical protein VLC98_08655 [Phnomibacter sp.]|nr:hypothetical protein [Phnomibacter sp.]